MKNIEGLEYSTVFFDDLPLLTYHKLLALRVEVFVVEQNCPYQDVDFRDVESHHVVGYTKDGEVAATARIVSPGLRFADVSIGRVVLAKDYRGSGEGDVLMKQAIEATYQIYGDVPIRISAQAYLENFYARHGFKPTGKRYLEDDIPHLEMLR